MTRARDDKTIIKAGRNFLWVSVAIASRRDVPRRARRFNAGTTGDSIRVPKGRLTVPAGVLFSRPFGTCPGAKGDPALN